MNYKLFLLGYSMLVGQVIAESHLDLGAKLWFLLANVFIFVPLSERLFK